MYSNIKFRTGDEAFLVSEFLKLEVNGKLKFEVANLEPLKLAPDKILAVHYADGGAQGDAGAVEILYCSQQGVQVLYGNYAYGDLNLDDVIQKLPVIKCLDSRYSFTPPYPFGGKLEIPADWGYLYMGAMNHFFVRKTVAANVQPFINTLIQKGGASWQVFNAVAWLCMAKCTF